MKRVTILVIASTKQPVNVHYIETCWASVIRRTNADLPHISVFLLFEHHVELDRFSHLANNIIQDPTTDYERFCAAEHQTPSVLGILLKTVYALELLQNRYDVFFRTNLSSMLKLSAFDRFVQARDDLRYSRLSSGSTLFGSSSSRSGKSARSGASGRSTSLTDTRETASPAVAVSF